MSLFCSFTMSGPPSILLGFTIFLIRFRSSFCSFESNFLGDSISDEEYNNRTFCRTPVCMYDSGRLIFDADHDSQKTKPCDDFPTFAMGEFLKHRVLNDRYAYTGFQNDVTLQYYEKQKRILRKKLNVGEPKMFKVIKSFFKKCSNTGSISKSGQWEMFDYINELGGSPLTSGRSWNESSFSLEKWLKADPNFVFQVLFHFHLARCPERDDNKLCLNYGSIYYHDEFRKNDTEYILAQLIQISKDLKADAVENYLEFLLKKREFKNQAVASKNVTSEQITGIEDLQKRFPVINWMQIINQQLFTHSRVAEDEKVLVEKPEFFESFYEGAMNYNKSKIANALATAFLSTYKEAFIPYAFTQEEMKLNGATRSYQRFEQCLTLLEFNALPALKASEAQNLFDPEIQKKVAEFASEAIQDYRNEVMSKVLDDSIRTKIVKKIDLIKLIVMFPDDVLNVSKIESIYDELRLGGTENFVKMYVDLTSHRTNIEREPENSWIRILFNILTKEIEKYNPDMDVLYVPVYKTLHPSFHPNRPRFFNMVTVYASVSEALYDYFDVLDGIVLKKVYQMPDETEINYVNYKRWIENGGQDLALSGFKLTNLQMFWLCYAHVATKKFHFNYPETVDRALRLFIKYQHVYLKNSPYFREAFQCNAMTEDEIKRYEEFTRLYSMI